MKRTEVESSNINSVGYNAVNKVLEVEFHTGSIYHYKNISKIMAADLLLADSIGSFFNKNIRNDFEFEKGEYKEMITIPNIYICGKAGAGKTYAAKYLMDKCGYIQAKFAFPVYGLAYDYFRMDKKDRKLLQIIGTDAARDAVDKDIWVKRFVEDTKIVQLTRELMDLPNVGLVCDDCRFENEHLVLKKNGWIGIYLTVSDEIRIQRLGKRDGDAQAATLNHASELDVDKFKDDLIQIDSSKTVEETFKLLDELIEELKNKKEKING